MPTLLLTTKLYIPPVRPELVPRPRLIERLNVGLHHKLVLVSAPAGFGKTTLLSEWVAGCGRPVAWISLDKGDNDLSRFLAYFVAALQTLALSEVEGIEADIGVGVMGALQSPQPPPIEAVLTALVNEVATIPTPFILVLDDYHVITAQPIHDALTFLLDHLPPQMHLGLATRTDPPLPLPRLRIQDELTELRVADLRFTPEEATVFFNEVMGLGLSAEDVAALEARTEGWVAGLQVAALSLQGREDTASFIHAFTGSHRYILDYLVEEVLQQQPESVQTFLLRTAILDRLTGLLCDAVTGQPNGQATLERLERANLFIVPLDDERRWYRYHRLFADLLRARLQQTRPDRVADLHLRAAEWYEQNRLMAEAVDHTLAAGDFERAAHLAEQTAPIMLWMRGEVVIFLGWLEALPEELVHARPRLSLYHAWALLTTAQLDGVEARLRDVEHVLSRVEEPVVSGAERRSIQGEIAVIRAMIANFRGDEARTIELCHQALELVPEDNLFLRSTIAGNLGGAYAKIGDVVAASRAFGEASRLSHATDNTFTFLLATSYLAKMQVMQGQLRQAAETYQQTLELAAERGGQQSVGTAVAHVGLGELLREWNDLDGAARHLMEGIELGEWQGDVIVGPGLQTLMDGYLVLARVCQARGDVGGALEMIQKAEQLARKHDPSQIAQVTVARVRLWVTPGDPSTGSGQALDAAARWAQECGLSVDDEPSHQREFEYLTLARVLIAQNEQGEAMKLLERLLEAAEGASRMRSVIELLALQVLAFQAQGKTDRAMSALERALSLAEPEGYVRTFVDEGAPMERLLRRALSRGIAPKYVRELLAEFGVWEYGSMGETPPHPHTPTLPHPHTPILIEPLSPRELEVLRLVAGGLSNREIAEELFIAVTTVKKHVSNIFGKLGVTSRTQAVAQARELDLM